MLLLGSIDRERTRLSSPQRVADDREPPVGGILFSTLMIPPSVRTSIIAVRLTKKADPLEETRNVIHFGLSATRPARAK
jgi:hypothetical protein